MKRRVLQPAKQGTYVGTAKELEGFIFDMVGGSRQALMYRITSYIGNEFKEGGDLIRSVVNNLTTPEFVIPPDLPATASRASNICSRWNVTRFSNERIALG